MGYVHQYLHIKSLISRKCFFVKLQWCTKMNCIAGIKTDKHSLHKTSYHFHIPQIFQSSSYPDISTNWNTAYKLVNKLVLCWSNFSLSPNTIEFVMLGLTEAPNTWLRSVANPCHSTLENSRGTGQMDPRLGDERLKARPWATASVRVDYYFQPLENQWAKWGGGMEEILSLYYKDCN